VIQEVMPLRWKVILSVIVREKKVNMNMRVILNYYWCRAVWIWKYKSNV